MTEPVVTALRERSRGTVEVELDGRPWRIVPLDAAVAAHLSLGVRLDRVRAIALNRALREHRAVTIAARALRHADHTVATLDRRLLERGVEEPERRAALARLERAGAIDDARLAATRAAALARRGLGDAAIRIDLEGRGVTDALVVDALAALEPEVVRARAVVTTRGATVRTARLLAARGFDGDVIEAVLPPGGLTDAGHESAAGARGTRESGSTGVERIV